MGFISFSTIDRRASHPEVQTTSVVAQMHAILSHPPAIALSGGRGSTLSEFEEFVVNSPEEEEAIIEVRVFKLREKAIGLLGERLVEDIVSIIKSSHSAEQEHQEKLEKVVGIDNMQSVRIVYKMLQAESILDQLRAPRVCDGF